MESAAAPVQSALPPVEAAADWQPDSPIAPTSGNGGGPAAVSEGLASIVDQLTVQTTHSLAVGCVLHSSETFA